MDERADISGKQQISICFRHVSKKDFLVSENFVGFYETGSTDAESLFLILKRHAKKIRYEI